MIIAITAMMVNEIMISIRVKPARTRALRRVRNTGMDSMVALQPCVPPTKLPNSGPNPPVTAGRALHSVRAARNLFRRRCRPR